jgi:hypothetical protein
MDPLLWRQNTDLPFPFWFLDIELFWFCPNEAIVGNTAIIRISFSLVSFIDFQI